MEAAPTRLVSAPWVLPIATPPIADGAVALAADDAIVAVGTRKELRARYPHAEDERTDGALLPALVNAHTHLELSALSGRVSGGKGLVPWAMEVAQEAARMPAAQRADAAERAARAAVAAGTAAVGDVGNSLLAVPAIAEAGLGGVFFHELLGSRHARTGDALADAARERAELEAEHPWPRRLGYVPAPHAPYSADPDLLRSIFAAAGRSDHPTSIHVAEDAEEIALLRDGGGGWAPVLQALGVAAGSRTPRARPVAYLAQLGAFAAPRPPLLVHMVHADGEDRALAARHRATAVLCPRSNLHIGGRLADVAALLADGVALALGTDSLASTGSLSLWDEIATAAAQLPSLDASVWLRAATAGGAAALGLHRLGTLEPGKRPGLLSVPIADLAHPVDSLVRDLDLQPRWIATA